MSIPRVYDPADCDERGVPLDWDRCRPCDGSGRWRDPRIWGTMPGSVACETCGGHGSLKAAALASRLMRFRGSVPIPEAEIGHRCESCSHPMSEGTWEDGPRREWTAEDADLAELAGVPSGSGPRVHYSPCDEGCDHGGPARLRLEQRGEKGWIPVTDQRPGDALLLDRVDAVEASWRSVDIRTLGWPHDLRPEKLAVLCLRCFAERSSA